MKNYSNSDLSEDLLPKTRKEQFFFFFKNEFFTLFFLGFFILLCSLPLIAFAYLKQTYAAGIFENLLKDSYDKNNVLSYDLLINFVSFFILIIPLSILSIGLSGSYRILRCLCFEDGILFKSDFVKGIKLYYLQTFLSLIIVDALLFICRGLKFLFYFYLSTKAAYILSGILPVFFIINMLMEMTYLSMNTFYNTKTIRGFNGSIFLIIKKLPANLIFGLILGLFYIVIVSSNLIVNAIVLFLGILIILPFILLAHMLLNLTIFDGDFNNESPEYKNKGLHIK